MFLGTTHHVVVQRDGAAPEGIGARVSSVALWMNPVISKTEPTGCNGSCACTSARQRRGGHDRRDHAPAPRSSARVASGLIWSTSSSPRVRIAAAVRRRRRHTCRSRAYVSLHATGRGKVFSGCEGAYDALWVSLSKRVATSSRRRASGGRAGVDPLPCGAYGDVQQPDAGISKCHVGQRTVTGTGIRSKKSSLGQTASAVDQVFVPNRPFPCCRGLLALGGGGRIDLQRRQSVHRRPLSPPGSPDICGAPGRLDAVTAESRSTRCVRRPTDIRCDEQRLVVRRRCRWKRRLRRTDQGDGVEPAAVVRERVTERRRVERRPGGRDIRLEFQDQRRADHRGGGGEVSRCFEVRYTALVITIASGCGFTVTVAVTGAETCPPTPTVFLAVMVRVTEPFVV